MYIYTPGCPCCKCPCTNPVEKWNIQYDTDCECLRGTVQLAFVADVNGCCTWTGTLICGPTYTTWTLVVCFGSVTLTITDHTDAVLLVFSMTPGTFNCSGPNTLTAVTNNLPCTPPDITIVPYCPTCSIQLKKFDEANGLEIWNQVFGHIFPYPTFDDGATLFTGCLPFFGSPDGIAEVSLADGTVSIRYPVTTVPYVDADYLYAAGGFRYSRTTGARDTGWPAEFPSGNIHFWESALCSGVDGGLACYGASGSAWLIKTEGGTVLNRDGGDNPTAVPDPENPFGGSLTGVALFKGSTIYMQNGETRDTSGNKLTEKVYDAATAGYYGPGLNPSWNVTRGVLSDGSWIATSMHEPSGSPNNYRFIKCKNGAVLDEFTITDLADEVGGNNISWHPSVDGDFLFINSPQNSNSLRYYAWGTPTALWARDIVAGAAGIGLPFIATDGKCYAGGSPPDVGPDGTLGGVSDPYTVNPHCLPDWHPEGCLTGPAPYSGLRASAGVATPMIAVTISGVGDSACSCGSVNGTYILSPNAGGYSYVGAPGSAICATCDGLADEGTGKLSITLLGSILTIQVGSNKHLVTFGVYRCSGVDDCSFGVDPVHPLQLDTGEPNTLTYLQGSIDGAVQQCDWTAATITITGVLS